MFCLIQYPTGSDPANWICRTPDSIRSNPPSNIPIQSAPIQNPTFFKRPAINCGPRNYDLKSFLLRNQIFFFKNTSIFTVSKRKQTHLIYNFKATSNQLPYAYIFAKIFLKPSLREICFGPQENFLILLLISKFCFLYLIVHFFAIRITFHGQIFINFVVLLYMSELLYREKIICFALQSSDHCEQNSP